MNLRLSKIVVLLVVTAAWLQSARLQGQGSRQQSYRTATPFGSAGRRDASPLDSVDGSINQSIDLRVNGTFNAGQSGSSGLDQIQSSRPAGRQTALSLSDTMTGRGAQKYIPVRVSAKPSYIGVPLSLGPTITGMSPLLPNGQVGSMGANSNTLNPRVAGGVPALGVEARRRAGANKKTNARESYEALPQRGHLGSSDFPVAQEGTANSLERLQDPFLAPSTASFEGFKQRPDFEQSCGDACSLGKAVSGEPLPGEPRGRRRAGDLPESEIPATKGVYGQEPSGSGMPGGGLTTKPN